MENSVQIDIRSIQHIGIPVTDIVRSEVFYNRLGFSRVMEAPFQHEGAGGICRMMKRDSIIIELYQLPERNLDMIRQRKDGHIDHIAFDVQDVEATFRTLKSAGFDIIEPAPVFLNFWQNGCKYFNIKGPDGERLEFNQIL